MPHPAKLIISKASSAAMNMALDEILTQQAQTPILRFHAYNTPAITIGYFENPARTLEMATCKRKNIKPVRRLTGGRAVYHDGDCTFSLIIPEKTNITDASTAHAYKAIAEGVREALTVCGAPAEISDSPTLRHRHGPCFSAVAQHEVTIDGRKILGMAQKRTKAFTLVQNTLLITRACLGMADYMKGNVGTRLDAHLACLEEWAHDVTREQIQTLLQKHIGDRLNCSWQHTRTSDEILHAAEQLAHTRYETDVWNLARMRTKAVGCHTT